MVVEAAEVMEQVAVVMHAFRYLFYSFHFKEAAERDSETVGRARGLGNYG